MKRVSDGNVLDLIQAFLDQDILEEAKRWTPSQGTPQGAVLSPLLANLYLHPLDADLTGAGYRIVRYAETVGRENAIAGTGCGFGSMMGQRGVADEVAWAKFGALVEEAALASRQLWQDRTTKTTE